METTNRTAGPAGVELSYPTLVEALSALLDPKQRAHMFVLEVTDEVAYAFFNHAKGLLPGLRVEGVPSRVTLVAQERSWSSPTFNWVLYAPDFDNGMGDQVGAMLPRYRFRVEWAITGFASTQIERLVMERAV